MSKFEELGKEDFAPDVKLIPKGYIKDENGIFKIITVKDLDGSEKEIPIPLSYSDFNFTRKLENKDTGEVFYEISFKNKIIRIAASELVCKKGIVSLAGYGINTIESKAKDLCAYFMEYWRWNDVPECEEYDRFGWKPDGSFVLGRYKYTKDGRTLISLLNPGKEINAIQENGTISGWVEAIKQLMEYNNQRIKMYIACVPPILRIISEDNFSQVDQGDTSKGKTITAKASMSIYGNPDEIMLSGDTTKYALEVSASVFCDIPIFLDDIQNMDSKLIEAILYMVGNGVGKARGTKTGGLREVLRWRSVGFFTSEKPVINQNSFGGLAARVLNARNGLGGKDDEAVKTFEDKIESNSGVFAPILINWILNNVDEIKQIHKNSRKTIRDEAEQFKDKEQRNVINRIGGTYATILTAGKIFEALYGSEGGVWKDPILIIKDAFKETVESSNGTYAERGIDHMLSWIAANDSYFLHEGAREISMSEKGTIFNAKHKILGDIRTNEYFIIPSELQTEFKRADFNHERLIIDFIEKGFLDTDLTKKHGTKTVKVEGKSTRVYAFNRPKIDPKEEE